MTWIIKVVPYQSVWPELFEAEAKRVKHALGDNCIAIHHIGSTAIPDLAAKPVIDMVPVVKNIQSVDQTISAMEQLGYEAMGEFGIPFRRYFQKGGDDRTHNIHVFEEGNPEIDRHLKFRDWMRTHENDRNAYGKLKLELAAKFPDDILSYCTGKDGFVAEIDSKTGCDGIRMVKALTDPEWKAVHRFRQGSKPEPEDVHFVLYHGAKIIGYAHIQFQPENKSSLNIMIDEQYRNPKIESEFQKLCQRWLLQQNQQPG